MTNIVGNITHRHPEYISGSTRFHSVAIPPFKAVRRFEGATALALAGGCFSTTQTQSSFLMNRSGIQPACGIGRESLLKNQIPACAGSADNETPLLGGVGGGFLNITTGCSTLQTKHL